MKPQPKPVSTPPPAIVVAMPAVRPPGDVLHDACSTYGVSLEALTGPGRSSWLVKARTAVALELRSMGLSLHEIGGILNRHHTTVLYLLGGAGR